MPKAPLIDKLLKRLRNLKGVLHAEKVSGIKSGTQGVRLTVDSTETKKRIAKDHKEVSWPATMIRYYRSHGEDPPLGVFIDGLEVFIREQEPPHSDIKPVEEHYLIYMRLYFKDGYKANYPPQWQLWSKCEQLPNPDYKPHDMAKKMVAAEMARIFDPKEWQTQELDEEQDEDCCKPTYRKVQGAVPYKAEFRIVKVTTVQTVTDYEEATNEKDANASTGAS